MAESSRPDPQPVDSPNNQALLEAPTERRSGVSPIMALGAISLIIFVGLIAWGMNQPAPIVPNARAAEVVISPRPAATAYGARLRASSESSGETGGRRYPTGRVVAPGGKVAYTTDTRETMDSYYANAGGGRVPDTGSSAYNYYSSGSHRYYVPDSFGGAVPSGAPAATAKPAAFTVVYAMPTAPPSTVQMPVSPPVQIPVAGVVPSVPVPQGGSTTSAATTGGLKQDEQSQFMASNQGTPQMMPGSLSAPSGQYEIPAGSYIPAMLDLAVDSDLSGPVRAHIPCNLRDFRNGAIVIPGGSWLLGRYDGVLLQGQRHLAARWEKIVYPDDEERPLFFTDTLDQEGHSGLSGRVDTHSWQIFRDTLVSSIANSAGQIAGNAIRLPGGVQVVLNGQQSRAQGAQVSVSPNIVLGRTKEFLLYLESDYVVTHPYPPTSGLNC